MAKPLLYLWLCAGSLVATFIVCIASYPYNLLSHDGLSYYGNIDSTRLPYSIGLVVAAYFVLRACWAMGGMQTQTAKSFRVGLEAIAIAALGIVATPSLSANPFVQNLHVLFGFVMFLAQAALSMHYLIRARGDAADWILLGLQFVAIAIAGLSFEVVGVLHLMLPAQLLAIFAFGALLIRAASHNGGQIITQQTLLGKIFRGEKFF